MATCGAPSEARDEDIRLTELRLKDFAEGEGFCFVATFHEYESGSHAAFAQLTEELKRVEARHVVVASLHHLSRNRILQEMMLVSLEFEATAQVGHWTISHE